NIPMPRIHVCDRMKNPLKAGDRVIAVGNPFGERDHVTDGIISNSDAFGDIEPESVFIRTSAPINGGNSGGGLFRVRREKGKLITELVGINTWGYRGGDGVSGSIDIRVIALQCHEWGVPIVSDEEIAAYRQWWEKEIVPFQEKLPKQQEMPYADD
ncbi:trypsin-like peptidase domain-containing protein, partial [Candidatus Peregrinibacteria bacterium]|nr:trypsin-like peptidase domain-containing protein [Candidatus Peregrinibacteria bacterium]